MANSFRSEVVAGYSESAAVSLIRQNAIRRWHIAVIRVRVKLGPGPEPEPSPPRTPDSPGVRAEPAEVAV